MNPYIQKQTMTKKKAVLNWSGGKDSAHALYKVLQEGEYEVVSLLTTINASTHLSTMHNIPIELLQIQSNHIGIPLKIVGLQPKGTMSDYNSAMDAAVEDFKLQGVTHFIFGDIYLHDVRSYREQQLSAKGITVLEPLWDQSSQQVMNDFLSTGLQTMIVTTMADGLGKSAIGRVIDADFVASLPSGTDPNGENGEYHTFCFDGPIYSSPIPFEMGKPYSKSFDIGLDDGSTQTFTYCFVDLKTKS